MSETEAANDSDTSAVSEAYTRRVRQVRDDLDGLLGDLGERVGDADRVVREKLARAEQAMREGVGETEVRIRESPFLAIGVAVAIGFIAGLVAGVGSRDR